MNTHALGSRAEKVPRVWDQFELLSKFYASLELSVQNQERNPDNTIKRWYVKTQAYQKFTSLINVLGLKQKLFILLTHTKKKFK